MKTSDFFRKEKKKKKLSYYTNTNVFVAFLLLQKMIKVNQLLLQVHS